MIGNCLYMPLHYTMLCVAPPPNRLAFSRSNSTWEAWTDISFVAPCGILVTGCAGPCRIKETRMTRLG